jgi:succinate dehydrogenase / fumarate reductase flavoprotein subunit
MQGLADGYFVLPATIGNYLAAHGSKKVKADAPEFLKAEEDVRNRTSRLLGIRGKKSVDHFHRELGILLWDKCGMARNDAGLREALKRIPLLREEFWENVNVLGESEDLNQSLEKAGRVADFLEFAELLCYDALNRRESCGGHFREEFQTADGEAKRNDEEFAYVSAWEYVGENSPPQLHKESLEFETVHLATRSYK